MLKTTLAITALALTTLGLQQRDEYSVLKLKEEEMRVEYTANSGETALIVQAESETSLGRVEVRAPRGGKLLEVASGDRPLQGFVVETMETSREDFIAKYREGMYDLRGRTIEGKLITGRARLVHDLLPAPVVLTPREGATGVALNPVITWVPDPQASGYQIVVEQGDSDGLTATVTGSSSSFQVPYGILEPGTESHVEVGAIGPNGNCTLVEVTFTTL